MHASSLPSDPLYQAFRNPPARYSLMPYWYWNGKITPERTRYEIGQMLRQGVHQAILFPWDGMEVPYLSESYYHQLGAALRIATELHFTLNLADEFDWPSGHAWDFWSNKPALSRVLQQHPEFRMRRLEYAETVVTGPKSWTAEGNPALVVAAREDGAGKLNADSLVVLPESGAWQVPSGRWLITTYRLVATVGAHNTRVDLLNPDAVKTYLQLVYEEYARRFSQYFGTTLQLTVADHEGTYGVPIAFTPRLWEEFRARKGYDLRRMLPLLVHDTSGTVRSRTVRKDYFDVISALYVNSFTKQVADWCVRHHLLHGTSAYEEQLFIQVGGAGNMFDIWRSGSLVEIDALLERARMPLDFKEAVSVAHFDRKMLLVENQGLQGHGTFFSLEKARLGTNMCLLWGANRLVPYFDYDQSKITWPPQWFLSQPLWRYFRHYADYVRRAQFMNAQGSHIAPILIYYPLETAFAHAGTLVANGPHHGLVWNNTMDQTQNIYSALQLELARQGWDYHVVDSDYLKRAEIRGSSLRLGDEQFRVLILPPMTDIAPSSIQKIRQFADAGGVVLAVGSQPRGLPIRGIRHFLAPERLPFMARLDYMVQIQVPVAIQQDLRPVLNALRSVEPPQVQIEGDRDHFFFSHRQRGDVDWYWVVNDSDHARNSVWRFPGEGHFEKWDPETGRRSSLCNNTALHFGPWDAFFVVRSPGEAGPCPSLPKDQVLMTLPRTGWHFSPETPKLYVPYVTIAGSGKHIWLQPERLSNGKWWLTGPFPFDDHKGFYRVYPPEKGFDSSQGWTWFESPTYTVTIRDGLPKGRSLGIYYAYVNVYSPTARRGGIVTAFADSMRLWWNGDLKMSVHRHAKWSLLRDAWAEHVVIKLRRGWNSVLLKIGPSLMVPTAFLFRITDENGATMRDLVYSRDRVVTHTEPKPERLTVEVPPGADPAVAPTIDWREIPEHPVAFSTGTVPFTLQSWTDSALRYFSGTAIYETEFHLPSALPKGRLILDLGSVGSAAEVWLNDRKVGERVWRPYELDITGFARPGRNRLRIRVANSDAGRQSQGDTIYPQGSWGLKYKTERDRLPFIRPNGLEGPVRILMARD